MGDCDEIANAAGQAGASGPVIAQNPMDKAMTDAKQPDDAAPARKLTPEAQRALAEAAERRAKAKDGTRAAEVGGRGGLEPARYGDWEIKGIACDF